MSTETGYFSNLKSRVYVMLKGFYPMTPLDFSERLFVMIKTDGHFIGYYDEDYERDMVIRVKQEFAEEVLEYVNYLRKKEYDE